MTILLRLILLLILIAVVASGFGVRVHLEHLPAHLAGKDTRPHYEVRLKQGQVLVGTHLEDLGDAIRIRMAGGKLEFAKLEIESYHAIAIEELDSGRYDDLIVRKKKEPVITVLEEDKWFQTLTSSVGEMFKIDRWKEPLITLPDPGRVAMQSKNQWSKLREHIDTYGREGME